ncbi:hypothetical protein DdX_14907 [Ditylenchus destructor]|uniref:Uncharacterized protein n=1 Tax=Ditylenchus destructor TaxID=166010 RepID=A0AAD4R1J5_9BILA|nr:hypothetical protein DdX_14907 [Ditylenchus destructor]
MNFTSSKFFYRLILLPLFIYHMADQMKSSQDYDYDYLFVCDKDSYCIKPCSRGFGSCDVTHLCRCPNCPICRIGLEAGHFRPCNKQLCRERCNNGGATRGRCTKNACLCEVLIRDTDKLDSDTVTSMSTNTF